MTRHDYQESQHISQATTFNAIIMAAMRKADTVNQVKLIAAWPALWAELSARYHAPGGRLPDDYDCRADLDQERYG